ncbi:MAG: DUF6531 domain-containing protein [Bdellovibrionota bacterium]
MAHISLKQLVIVGILLTACAFGLNVNRINGGGSIVYVDFNVPGDVVPLDLVRTYNSVTAVNEASGWNGAFGWGWTSDFESVLTVTPDRSVVLRDGQSGNTVIFQAVKDDPKAKEAFFAQIKKAYLQRKLGKEPSDAELKKFSLPSEFMTKLKSDSQFRIQMAVAYDIPGEIPKGELLVSTQYGYQTIQFQNNQWIRRRDGSTHVFDQKGRLIRQEDRNGYYLEYKYDPGKLKLKEISARNQTASLKFTWQNNRVSTITDSQGRMARYDYDTRGNLVRVDDSNGQTYEYVYKNERFPHLLTRINYPSESKGSEPVYRELRYDSQGLVASHRDKDGSITEFTYGKKPNDPANNFWTKTVFKNKQALKDPDERYEEFFLKARPDGSRYLYKQVSRSSRRVGNKRETSSETILFTECCGKPSQIVRGGQTTKFKYYPNGLLKEKVGPRESVAMEYEPKFMKVSKVVKNGVTSVFQYDARGNLVKAVEGKKFVGLKYDKQGRIQEMSDTNGGQIKFQYGNQGKPVLIEQKGVGTIQISYNPAGGIARTETLLNGKNTRKPSAMESKRIVRQVMGSFQTLLDIIRPAAQVNKALPLAWKVVEK